MWAPILEEALAPYPDTKIVLSTSWVRVLKSFSRVRAYLPVALQARVIGATWHSAMARHHEGSHRIDGNWFSEMSRYAQIARYISRAGLRAEHWLAIDDDCEGWPSELRDRLVETDGALGLSSAAAQSELAERLQQIPGFEEALTTTITKLEDEIDRKTESVQEAVAIKNAREQWLPIVRKAAQQLADLGEEASTLVPKLVGLIQSSSGMRPTVDGLIDRYLQHCSAESGASVNTPKRALQAERKAAARMRDERDSLRQRAAARVAGTKRSDRGTK